MTGWKSMGRAICTAALALVSAGCLAAAGAAAAGAGSAVYLTDRAASSLVQAPITEVAERTRMVFEEFQIEFEDEEVHESGNDIEIRGRNGSLDITVDMERREAGVTFVEVSAREGDVIWHKDYAEMVLMEIAREQ